MHTTGPLWVLNFERQAAQLTFVQRATYRMLFSSLLCVFVAFSYSGMDGSKRG